jgi:hypothetical protein
LIAAGGEEEQDPEGRYERVHDPKIHEATIG